MNFPDGKGLYIHTAKQVVAEFGSVENAVFEIKKGGFTHIFLKSSNGWYAWTPLTPEAQHLLDFHNALIKAGIKVFLWHYSYSYTQKEIDAIMKGWKSYPGASGFVVNAEIEYCNNPNSKQFTVWLMNQLRNNLPGVSIGMTSFRYPTYFPKFPWETWFNMIDYYQPQVYWVDWHNPDAQLKRSIYECNNIKSDLPLYPIGSSYPHGNWAPSTTDCEVFSKASRDSGMKGISWWTMHHAKRLGLWPTLRNDTNWPVQVVPPEVPDVGKNFSDMSRAEKDDLLKSLAISHNYLTVDGNLVNNKG